ncbi:MAG: hypothetical protein ACP5KE_05210 [Candidatus Methanodesulfokora sp.]
MRIKVLLIVLLLLPSLNISACPPTAGYVGAVYSQGITESEAMSYLNRSGIASKLNTGFFSFSPYFKDGLRAIYIEIGSYEEGAPLKAYIFPGSKYTLLLVETDASLNKGPLLYAESLLSGLLNPRNIVNESGSPNNWNPPAPYALWIRLERGVEVKVNVVRCGFVYSRLRGPQTGRIGVIANEIDYNLSFGIIKRIESRGVGVDYLGFNEESMIKASKYRVVIFLGGHLAPATGKFVLPLLRNKTAYLRHNWLISPGTWGTGGIFIVIAGSDRYMTRRAAEEFLMRWADFVIRAAREGAVFMEFNSTAIMMVSSGRCGILEEPELQLSSEGNYIKAVYREGHSDPCARFYIAECSMTDREIRITLGRQSTSLICVQCIGVITANITIGPLPPGDYKVCINGICGHINISKS